MLTASLAADVTHLSCPQRIAFMDPVPWMLEREPVGAPRLNESVGTCA